MVCQNMGKASKWIRNFLLGKREKEDKKRVSSIPEQELGSLQTAELSVTKEKRRWSFRKPAGTTPRDKITNRNRSFDSISTAQLVKQVLEEHEIDQIRVKAHAFIKSCNRVNGSGSVLVATARKSELIKPFMKDSAATKIQSAFRSYLARKALRALRSLVKLQALVRGHQVRKQTAEVLRSMHALMTIQVRARYKRVQMVELVGPPLNSTKSTTYQESDLAWKLPSKIHTDLDKLNGDETRRLQCKSGPLVVPQAEVSILEQVISKCHSSRLSTCKEWEDQPHYGDDRSWSPSTMLAEIISSQTNAKQIFNNDIEYKPEFSRKLPASGVPQPHLDSPSYMSNTESSKAKVRSQSEPKQRPKRALKQKISRRATSSEGLNVDPELAADQQLIKHSSYLRYYNEQENQQPWLFKLYRSV